MRYEAEHMKTGKKVRVYWNLHKKCFSVISLEKEKKGLVVAHVNQLNLDSPVFKVSEKGRQRVLIEKKKNVHAYVKGTVAPLEGLQRKKLFIRCFQTACYEPYTMESFETFPDETPIYEAPHVIFRKGELFVSRRRKYQP